MSLSRSPIWMHRPGSLRSSVDCFRFSSQRMLSFFSMGTLVGLIFFLSAAVPLNFFLVQNLMAANPSGTPSIVTARLECIRMPQTVCDLRRPSYAGFWVTRRSGGVVCRHLDDLDAVCKSDTCDDLRQLICSFQSPPGV